jgi:hypothetical protein
MRAPRLSSLVLLALAATPASAQFFRNGVATVASSPDGAWNFRHTLAPQAPGANAAYYPTAVSEFAAAVPVLSSTAYLLPDAPTSNSTRGDAWLGLDVADNEQRFYVFETYATADEDVTIFVALSGDDGHSLFVDDQFVAGGGFGELVPASITLHQHAKTKITLAGYNAGGGFTFSVGFPNPPSPPPQVPLYIGGLQAPFSHVRLNAKGAFPGIDGPIQNLGNLTAQYNESVLLNNGKAAASSFVTGPSAYLLDSVTITALSEGDNMQEVRLRADDNNKPGALVGSLGFQSGIGDPAGRLTYASTGILLAPNTRYWLSTGERGFGDFVWRATYSANVDAPTAWTIGDRIAFSEDAGDSWSVGSAFGQPVERMMFRISAEDLGAYPAADFNRDHKVDATDFLLWRQDPGQAVGAYYYHGDANRDGAVDGFDFLVWQRQFGTVPVVPAPEPSAAALLLFALGVLAPRRRIG